MSLHHVMSRTGANYRFATSTSSVIHLVSLLSYNIMIQHVNIVFNCASGRVALSSILRIRLQTRVGTLRAAFRVRPNTTYTFSNIMVGKKFA